MEGEDPAYLREQLLTYLGNKRALLPLVGQAIQRVRQALRKDKLIALDLFSGSGVVARFLKQFSAKLIVNDLEAYSGIVNRCYLANAAQVPESLAEMHRQLVQAIPRQLKPGTICELYAPQDESNIRKEDRVFYTRRNAMYLDTARAAIAELPEGLQHFFLAPLLAQASVHANTSGVFKGFYKNAAGVGQFGGTGRNALSRILGEIALPLPIFSRFDCEVEIHRRDANELVKELAEVDLAYFDPPYNQHPYGSNYFMLNLLVHGRKPASLSKVSGIPGDWNRSQYNRRPNAETVLFEAVADCRAKFILVSYNSEGFIDRGRFVEYLKTLGELEICETPYNTFRGSRNLRNRDLHVTEFLYLLRKRRRGS